MQYTFSTIEEFVRYCDDKAEDARRKMTPEYAHGRKYHENMGTAVAYEDIARILRNSNVGIVIPK